MLKILRLVVFAIGVLSLWAFPAVAEEGDASTMTLKASVPEDIYGGAKYRDPLKKVSASAARASVAKVKFTMEDFSIHEVDLTGIMKDRKGAYAVLVDVPSGTGLILRKGRIYTFKKKRIPGVTGRINVAQKTVILLTADKDVQTLRLGGDEEEAYDEE